jgi:hypothetical protein
MSSRSHVQGLSYLLLYGHLMGIYVFVYNIGLGCALLGHVSVHLPNIK